MAAVCVLVVVSWYGTWGSRKQSKAKQYLSGGPSESCETLSNVRLAPAAAPDYLHAQRPGTV